MGLAGVDAQTCSALTAQLQGSKMEELGGIIAALEQRYPELKRRLVVALSGYNTEVSPVGLANRTEWTELVRNGFAYALGTNQAAVVASLSAITLITSTAATMLRSILVSSPVATEIAITDSAGGAGFAAYGAPSKNLLRGGPAGLNSLFVGAGAFAGTIYRRFFIAANTPVELSRETLDLTHNAQQIGVWNLTANQALDVTFEWAEVPATWPL